MEMYYFWHTLRGRQVGMHCFCDEPEKSRDTRNPQIREPEDIETRKSEGRLYCHIGKHKMIPLMA